jgi:hypothetical protein
VTGLDVAGEIVDHALTVATAAVEAAA